MTGQRRQGRGAWTAWRAKRRGQGEVNHAGGVAESRHDRERCAKRGETRHAPFLSVLREGDREMHEMVNRDIVDEDTDVLGQSGFVEAT